MQKNIYFYGPILGLPKQSAQGGVNLCHAPSCPKAKTATDPHATRCETSRRPLPRALNLQMHPPTHRRHGFRLPYLSPPPSASHCAVVNATATESNYPQSPLNLSLLPLHIPPASTASPASLSIMQHPLTNS